MRMRSNNKRSYTEFSSESFDETNSTTLCFTVTSKKHDSGSPKSGKWSQEEEQYALQLIHDFEMGTLGKFR
jgi:hypothetical protein